VWNDLLFVKRILLAAAILTTACLPDGQPEKGDRFRCVGTLSNTNGTWFAYDATTETSGKVLVHAEIGCYDCVLRGVADKVYMPSDLNYATAPVTLRYALAYAGNYGSDAGHFDLYVDRVAMTVTAYYTDADFPGGHVEWDFKSDICSVLQ